MSLLDDLPDRSPVCEIARPLRCASSKLYRPVPWAALSVAVILSVGSCKNGTDEPTCVPEDHLPKTVRVLIQPTDQLNPDEEGNPLSVVFRIYQLTGNNSVDLVEFKKVWKEGGEVAFGDEYLAEKEITVYPDDPDILEIEPDPAAAYLVAVAIFNEPIGQDWFRAWDMPKYHGHSYCNADKQKKPYPDPCFYVFLDRYLVDGGHRPPSGWDDKKLTAACPGPPMKTPPPPPPDKKKKKKKKKLKDLKAPEAPEAPEAPAAPEKPGG